MATFTGQPGVAADYLEPGLSPVAAVVVPNGVALYSRGNATVIPSTGQLAGLATVSP